MKKDALSGGVMTDTGISLSTRPLWEAIASHVLLNAGDDFNITPDFFLNQQEYYERKAAIPPEHYAAFVPSQKPGFSLLRYMCSASHIGMLSLLLSFPSHDVDPGRV